MIWILSTINHIQIRLQIGFLGINNFNYSPVLQLPMSYWSGLAYRICKKRIQNCVKCVNVSDLTKQPVSKSIYIRLHRDKRYGKPEKTEGKEAAAYRRGLAG